MAARNPGNEKPFVPCLAPGFRAVIFFAVFFRVTHDGLSERRFIVTSLVLRCFSALLKHNFVVSFTEV